MPQKLPDKYSDPDGYEDEQARRTRAARNNREAYDLECRLAGGAQQAHSKSAMVPVG
jgi:hypothetical protein